MQLKLKGSALLVLTATALVCARVMFSIFDDPEGPNLLVVTVVAVFIYALSLVVYGVSPVGKDMSQDVLPISLGGHAGLFIVIVIQIVITVTFYYFLS